MKLQMLKRRFYLLLYAYLKIIQLIKKANKETKTETLTTFNLRLYFYNFCIKYHCEELQFA